MPEHVCPVWVGYLLASPLRKLFQDPHKILAPYVRPGMRVLDIGCAMGFFSLPLAQLVGPTGRVVCVDLQEKMLEALRKRARKAGVLERLEPRLCHEQTLGLADLKESIDFALAFAMVHEVPDPERLLAEIGDALKPGARFLVAEPTGHVAAEDFEKTIAVAARQGLTVVETPRIRRSRSALFQKAGQPR
jgi:ubiquinone/menaquinone biosynthesis C-methylase UbiE